MKIPLKPNQIIRETSCSWEWADDKGEIQKTNIRVLYKGRSVKEARQSAMDMIARKKEDEPVTHADLIFPRIHRLPDILGDSEVTLDFLEDQDIENLKRLDKAILDADNPEKK